MASFELVGLVNLLACSKAGVVLFPYKSLDSETVFFAASPGSRKLLAASLRRRNIDLVFIMFWF